MVKKLFILFGLLLVLALGIRLPVLASPNAQATEPPPSRPLYDPSMFAAAMDPAIAGVPHEGETLPPPAEVLSAQSNVAFMQLDGNYWNVYLYDTFTHALYQLTNNGADNTTPRINPSHTRIAFSSFLDGYTELIYSMNLDGSDVTPISHISGYSPYWSPDGTKIVFGSTWYQSEGEIYTMATNGYDLQPLTDNTVYDGMPSWSPDGTKIAYVSYVTGSYRVWVMNTDGTGAVQLSQEAYSGRPAWSPDGSQIAYDCDFDNDTWQELCLMNSDGSNRHMVFNPGGANTDALSWGWNPGGTSLTYTLVEWVFVSPYWYWNHAYLGCYSIDPGGACFNVPDDLSWYPDWSSTDRQPPVTNMPALPAQVPYQFTVTWGGYDPGEAGITLYNVQARDGLGGAWTDWQPLTTATSASYTGLSGHTYYFRTQAYDNVGNVSAWTPDYQTLTSVETLAPETAVMGLPAFARNVVTVRWAGVDYGGSGIRDYDIQFSDPALGGNWVTWLSHTTQTSEQFSGAAGHTYYFRSRATDEAGNVEAWPPGNGDAQTIFYDWLVDGIAMDILGAPIMGAEAAITMGEAGRVPSDFAGDYTSYGTAALTELVSWSNVGYTPLPETTFDGFADRGLDVFLPPADNSVQNWGFEPNLAGWQTSGTAIPDTLPHTGNRSARLGTAFSFGGSLEFEGYTDLTDIGGFEPDAAGGVHALWRKGGVIDYRYRSPAGIWSDVEYVASHAFMTNPPPTLLVTEDGTAHVFFIENEVLYHTYRISAGNWSALESISGTNGVGNTQIVAATEAGSLHVAWVCYTGEISQVCYNRQLAGGAWDGVVQVTNLPDVGTTFPFQMIVQDGTVHLMWDRVPRTYYSRRDVTGVWTEAEEICPTCADPSGTFIAVDASGLPQATWTHQWNDNPNWHNDLYFSQRTSSGTWSQPIMIGADASQPQMVIDQQGRTHIAWSGFTVNGLFHIYRDLDGTWQRTNPISDQWINTFDLFLDGQGAVHLVFPNGYTHWMGGPQWTPVVTFGGADQQVQVCGLVDIFGGVHVLWREALVSTSNLVYVSPHVVSTPGVSTLSQAVQVGDASTNPVLSFLSATGGANLESGATFSVTVSTGVTSTLVYSSTGWNAGWQHHAVDMSSWSGQVVTLTYSVAQPAGYPDAWAFVDEVVLGATYPDPWVSLLGGAPAALPGSQFSYQIVYGNHGGVESPGTSITLTLPSGLSFVSASVTPVIVGNQLIWDVGLLSPGSGPLSIDLIVEVDTSAPFGETLVTQVEIATTSPELETLNNSAQSETFIGMWVYLPVIGR